MCSVYVVLRCMLYLTIVFYLNHTKINSKSWLYFVLQCFYWKQEKKIAISIWLFHMFKDINYFKICQEVSSFKLNLVKFSKSQKNASRKCNCSMANYGLINSEWRLFKELFLFEQRSLIALILFRRMHSFSNEFRSAL